jgi:CHAD domain-containing protein
MGPARDAEAWLSFLESPRVRRRLGTERGWTELVARQRARVARLYAGMRRRLRSGDWLEAERRAERLLGERIPPISDCSVSFGAFAARRIRKGYRRLLRLEPSSRGITPEELHAVRKQCKRVRYWAEFAAPALGRSVGELAVRLRAVTGALGGVHDMDVHLGVRGAAEGGMPAGLRGVMRKRRARSLAAFRRAWRAVTGGRFRARVLSGMRKAQA